MKFQYEEKGKQDGRNQVHKSIELAGIKYPCDF